MMFVANTVQNVAYSMNDDIMPLYIDTYWLYLFKYFYFHLH